MAHSAEALAAHLRDELLPWWRDHGADRAHGGFHETLDPEGQPGPETERRLRSVTRLLYAFGVGAELGVSGADALAVHACDLLRTVYRDPEHGGFFRTANASGKPVDRTKDAYDHAFAVFALATHHRRTGDPHARALAEDTAVRIREHLGGAPHGGYFESAAADWTPQAPKTRHQNPHMHWVEAWLALHAATGDARWLQEADALVRLFRDRFFEAETGTLGERFDTAWGVAGDDGPEERIEPGHHFEWVWLLARHRDAGGVDAAGDAADRLFAFAERAGVAENGLVFDAVSRDGTPHAGSHRLWPQTERVKALAVRGASGPLEAALDLLFARYATPRGWHEALAADGAPTGARQRATSVYHVVLALEEARRALP